MRVHHDPDPGRPRGEHPTAAFYCVSDQRYFLGAVGLINSLRLVGHTEPIYLLDCGLTTQQRELLAPEATLIDAPSDTPPTLLKTIAPLARPADVLLLLDADLVVTRPLTELIELTYPGRVVAFRDHIERFVPEWGEVLGLGEVRRQPYVAFAALCMDRSLGRSVLSLIQERQPRIDFGRGYWGRQDHDYPLLYADQDVLNAILASRVEEGRLVCLDARLAPTPPFTGLAVVDEDSLRCAFVDGVEPYVVHHHIVKPWLKPTHDGVYSRLLRRLLVGRDLAIRVPKPQIPLRFRRGALAYAERKRVDAGEQLRYRIRGPLRSRFRALRDRIGDGPSNAGGERGARRG